MINMTEFTIGSIASGSIVGLALGTWLYMWGGRSNKWVRRFIGSLVIATTVNVSAIIMGNWHWVLVLTYPCLIGGFCMGYSGSSLFEKVKRRALFALAVCSAGLVCCFAFGGSAWWVLPIHVGIAAFTIYLGVISKVQAAAEEVFVCLCLNAGLLMYPFIT